MLVKTKHFGEIDIEEERIINFKNGIMGFDQLTKYTLLHDETEDKEPIIHWLQSIEEEGFALPVISPYIVKGDYNPVVDEELLHYLEEGQEEEKNDSLLILLSLTIPENIKDISVNMKAPFIINSRTKKGIQVIAENDDYQIKHKIYNILQSKNAKKEEK